MKICIDAGHGGKDPGAVGHKGSKEKENTLAIAFLVGEVAKENGLEVIYTRDSDVFLGLTERANIANKEKCDIFVSIHNNSYSNPKANGIETWSYPGSSRGGQLSKAIQKSMIEYTGLADRGNKTARFTVLKKTNMPAVLLEAGFISNEKEEQLLKDLKVRIKIAQAITKGICIFLGITFKEKDFDFEDDSEENTNRKELILDIQKLLNKFNITDYEGKVLVEDGVMGKRTESAFKKLEKEII